MKVAFIGAPPGAGTPPEMPVHDRPIGDLLRHVRGWSDAQVAEVLAYQAEHGLRFGEAAVALGLASDDDVVHALSQQFHYPYSPDAAQLVNPELVAARDPFGAAAETMRELRSQLLMGVLDGSTRRALAVASANSGDGKTYLAANLAVAFSQLGGRTLVVDADLRTPRLHAVFGVDNGAGLSSLLSGRAEARAIQRAPGLQCLFVLPAGGVPPNPLELLQRPAFGLLLAEMLGKFDHVIVDTPAAEHGADARIIAARCGAVVAVGRKGRTRVKSLDALLGALRKAPVPVAGVVMNEH